MATRWNDDPFLRMPASKAGQLRVKKRLAAIRKYLETGDREIMVKAGLFNKRPPEGTAERT